MGRLRRRLTYANVVSTIALVLAVGGGAVYAASKVGAGGIRKNAIHSFHIKNKQVKRQDIAGGAINSNKVSNASLTGKDIKDDSLNGHDIDESSLGLVPLAQDARTLNGATMRVLRASQPSGSTPSQVLSQAGLTVSLSCPGGTATIEVRGAASGDFGTVFDSDSGGVQQFDFATPRTVITSGQVDPGIASVRRGDGTLTRLDFELLSIANGLGTQDDCFLNGVLVSGR
jgi:hypothetical protein